MLRCSKKRGGRSLRQHISPSYIHLKCLIYSPFQSFYKPLLPPCRTPSRRLPPTAPLKHFGHSLINQLRNKKLKRASVRKRNLLLSAQKCAKIKSCKALHDFCGFTETPCSYDVAASRLNSRYTSAFPAFLQYDSEEEALYNPD